MKTLQAALEAEEPDAYLHTYRKPGKLYTIADIGEHGPDPDLGFEHTGKEPVFTLATIQAALAGISKEPLSELLRDILKPFIHDEDYIEHRYGVFYDCNGEETSITVDSFDEALTCLAAMGEDAYITGWNSGVLLRQCDYKLLYSPAIGTFECPVCGESTPHEHSGEDVQELKTEREDIAMRRELARTVLSQRILFLEERYGQTKLLDAAAKDAEAAIRLALGAGGGSDDPHPPTRHCDCPACTEYFKDSPIESQWGLSGDVNAELLAALKEMQEAVKRLEGRLLAKCEMLAAAQLTPRMSLLLARDINNISAEAMEAADMAIKHAESKAQEPDPVTVCGCGKPTRYETSSGMACNKYMRCLTHQEALDALGKANLRLMQLDAMASHASASVSGLTQEAEKTCEHIRREIRSGHTYCVDCKSIIRKAY